MPERIARRMARAGLCSRREAERWIATGRVAVNGAVLVSPAVLVGAEDTIAVDGQLLPPPESTSRLWRYHKPPGLLVTRRDPQGRPTVFDRLPSVLPRTISIGRLDMASEGLLLLTNDGALASRLMHPGQGWIRRYRVRVHGVPDVDALAGLATGIRVQGVDYGRIEAGLDRRQGSNAWLTVALAEGRNREIRQVLAHLGLVVNRLIRTSFGPFQIGGLPRGAIVEVPAKVVREQLGGGGEGWAARTSARRRAGPVRRRGDGGRR